MWSWNECQGMTIFSFCGGMFSAYTERLKEQVGKIQTETLVEMIKMILFSPPDEEPRRTKVQAYRFNAIHLKKIEPFAKWPLFSSLWVFIVSRMGFNEH